MHSFASICVPAVGLVPAIDSPAPSSRAVETVGRAAG